MLDALDSVPCSVAATLAISGLRVEGLCSHVSCSITPHLPRYQLRHAIWELMMRACLMFLPCRAGEIPKSQARPFQLLLLRALQRPRRPLLSCLRCLMAPATMASSTMAHMPKVKDICPTPIPQASSHRQGHKRNPNINPLSQTLTPCPQTLTHCVRQCPLPTMFLLPSLNTHRMATAMVVR